MSPCIPFSGPGDVTGFICSRGGGTRGPRHYCVTCLRDGTKTPAPYLCDYPKGLGLPTIGKTCDKAMCAEHRTHVGPDCDHCPDHAQEAPRG